MHVGVAGSTGLIGEALVGRLRARGHEVSRLTRRPPASDEIQWDPKAGEVDRRKLDRCDAVVNLAGEPIGRKRWNALQKEEIRRSRVDGTATLARAIAELGPRPLVLASAIGYYGERGEEVLDESSAPGGGWLAAMVQEWESAADPARQAGARVVHLRTGVVLHRRGGALARMLPFFRLGVGGRLGTGRFWMSWISLDDIVEAYVHALETDAAGALNATSPAPARNVELTKALARVLRRPAVVPVPSWALRVVLGEMATDLLTSARVLPRGLLDRGFQFRHPDLTSALQAAVRS